MMGIKAVIFRYDSNSVTKAQARMKLLAIVIICSFVVQDSLSLIRSSGLSAAFVTGGNSAPASTIENQLTEKLRDVILNETAIYITQIVNDLARQIDIQSHLEVGLLKLALENFNYEMEQLPADSTPDSLDVALQSLNQKIVEAFNLIPTTLGGNLITKPKILPSPKKVKPVSSPKPPKVHTLTDFMTNVAQILETDLAALYKFEKKLLGAGFEGVGTAYPELQQEFRELAINEIVPTLQTIVANVQANQVIVQSHVIAATWTKFSTLNIQLMTIVQTTGITEAPEVTPATTEPIGITDVTETTDEATESVEETETESAETITELPENVFVNRK